MAANKLIVASGAVVALGPLSANLTLAAGGGGQQYQRRAGRVMLGAYVFVLTLSLLDMAGGGASRLATGLALVAALTSVLTQYGPVFTSLTSAIQHRASA